MNRILFLLFIAMAAWQANAQTLKPYDLVPYRKDTLWGFADTARKLVIAPKYDEVKFFDDAIAGVRLGSKWAFINKQGQELTPFKYDIVGTFSEGMVQVRANGKVGYLNNKAKEVVPPKYTFCEEFSEGLGIVRDSVDGKLLSGAVDKSGKLVIPRVYNIITSQFRSGFACISENERIHFIDKAGKKLQLPPGVLPYLEFSEGVAAVKVQRVNTALDSRRQTVYDTVYYLGLIDQAGKLLTDSIDNGSKRQVIDDAFYLATNFSNGFAIVQHMFRDYSLYAGAFENAEYAFLDKKGKLTGWYASLRPFGPDSLALVTKRGDYKSGLIDPRFQVVRAGMELSDAGLFSEGLLRVRKSQYAKWSFIDRNGQSPFPSEYDEVSDFYRGVSVVSEAGRNGCIDKQGRRFWE